MTLSILLDFPCKYQEAWLYICGQNPSLQHTTSTMITFQLQEMKINCKVRGSTITFSFLPFPQRR